MMQPLNLAVGETRTDRGPIDQSRGILTYRHFDGSLTDTYYSSIKSNKKIISERYARDCSLVDAALDLQYNVACEFFYLIDHDPYAEISEANHVLRPCFQNNLVALLSAKINTEMGLYSIARPTLRMIFESLMISKFCSANHESETYDKWIDGKVVYFTNGVIKKIKKPNSGQFSEFWSLISEFTHSSIYAMQPDTCIERVNNEIDLNFLLIHMLSECNYHLLNSHLFTPSLKYYQSRSRGAEKLQPWRKELTAIYSELKKQYNKPAKQFIRDFKSTWEVKNA